MPAMHRRSSVDKRMFRCFFCLVFEYTADSNLFDVQSLDIHSLTIAGFGGLDNVSATLTYVSIEVGNLGSLIIENIGLINVMMNSGVIDTLLFHRVKMSNCCHITIDMVHSLLQVFNSAFSTSTLVLVAESPINSSSTYCVVDFRSVDVDGGEVQFLSNGTSVITFENVNFWNASLELDGVLSTIDRISLSVNVSMTNCSFVGKATLFHNPIRFSISNCYFQQALESVQDKHTSKVVKFQIKDSCMFCDNYIIFHHIFSTVFAEKENPLLSFENVSFISMNQALLVYGPVNLTLDDCFFEQNRGSISPVLLYHACQSLLLWYEDHLS